jgi:dephospho-CoA kinase
MPPLVHLIQLHSPALTFRQTFLETTLKIFKEFAKERLKSRTLITAHEPQQLKPNYQEIEKTIDATKIGEEEFDRQIQTLTLEQISNFYKQKEALQQVANGNPSDLYIILEDDSINS